MPITFCFSVYLQPWFRNPGNINSAQLVRVLAELICFYPPKKTKWFLWKKQVTVTNPSMVVSLGCWWYYCLLMNSSACRLLFQRLHIYMYLFCIYFYAKQSVEHDRWDEPPFVFVVFCHVEHHSICVCIWHKVAGGFVTSLPALCTGMTGYWLELVSHTQHVFLGSALHVLMETCCSCSRTSTF